MWSIFWALIVVFASALLPNRPCSYGGLHALPSLTCSIIRPVYPCMFFISSWPPFKDLYVLSKGEAKYHNLQVVNSVTSAHGPNPSSAFPSTTKKPGLGPSFVFLSDITLWLSRPSIELDLNPRDPPVSSGQNIEPGLIEGNEITRSSELRIAEVFRSHVSVRWFSFCPCIYTNHSFFFTLNRRPSRGALSEYETVAFYPLDSLCLFLHTIRSGILTVVVPLPDPNHLGILPWLAINPGPALCQGKDLSTPPGWFTSHHSRMVSNSCGLTSRDKYTYDALFLV